MTFVAAFLQATQPSAGIGGIPPVVQPDISLWLVLAFAALNPAVVLVGYAMGRRADQPAKLVVAAFAAALAGAGLLWLGAILRISLFSAIGRAAAGVFALSLLFGGLYAIAGYLRRRPPAA